MRKIRWLAVLLLLAASGCDTYFWDAWDDSTTPPRALSESRDYRAIAGVSMGAYGAMNLGTKHSDIFGVIGSLGGPVDMQELMRDIVEDNLEVKSQLIIPQGVGDDFTFDHLPPYPSRDSRVKLMADLVKALGNPFLHHDPAGPAYLASDSEPAGPLQRQDDAFGVFTIPVDPRGFLDGGDLNEDGLRQTGEVPDEPVDVLLLAVGSHVPGSDHGGRRLEDLTADGVFDVGEGIIVNHSEPFTDGNTNLIYEPGLGETYSDFGLDGVDATSDFGEGNGQFDYDPDRTRWLDEDPVTRLAARPASEIATQRIYMDVGIDDEFGFRQHYLNLVGVLQGKGLTVDIQAGFSGDCVAPPTPTSQFMLIEYADGHTGIPDEDTINIDLAGGDVCGSFTIWQRLLSLIGYMNESFPGGIYGPGGDQVTGDVVVADLASPALAAGGVSVPQRVVVYRPPAFFNTSARFPIVYVLGGYGQQPEDFDRVNLLLDVLIFAGAVQNMSLAFLPGDGGRKGNFYVNHEIPDDQVPALGFSTSGRYEDSIIDDLIPKIENTILDGRIRP